jgi:hypothetical protein
MDSRINREYSDRSLDGGPAKPAAIVLQMQGGSDVSPTFTSVPVQISTPPDHLTLVYLPEIGVDPDPSGAPDEGIVLGDNASGKSKIHRLEYKELPRKPVGIALEATRRIF